MRRRHTYSFGGAVGPAAARFGRANTVQPWQRAVVVRNGKLSTLDAGTYRFYSRRVTIQCVDLRPFVVTAPMQETSTADGISVKVTLSGVARIADPLTYVTAQQDAIAQLYLSMQVAVRSVIASLTTDEIIATRRDLADLIARDVTGVEATGMVVDRLVVKDIVLPAEVKRAQAQVLLARSEGQAALERARGETAALRSLANAARLVSDQPALLSLRWMQTIGAGSGNTVVLGRDAPTDQLR